jgi:hypothetical protein
MNANLSRKFAFFLMPLFLAGLSLARPIPSPHPPPAKSCTTPEFHQLDFWIGDWDAFDFDAPHVVAARTRVDRILDGCALREDYRDTNGMQGQSFSIYDASRKVWHQSWVTNRGKLLVIEGQFRNGEMVLSGSDRTLQGSERLVRGTWKPVSGGVRETALTSIDGGKTWTLWFDILFRPHKP